MMNAQIQIKNPAVIWLIFSVRMLLFAVAFLWPAGTLYWWEAWVVIILWTVFGIAITNYLLRHDPALLLERLKFVPLHKDQKAWDKAIILPFFILAISLYLLPGFELVRYQWTEPLPLWIRIGAMIIHVPCFWMLGRIMRENTFLSQVVKIDEKRDHKVISTGPYALVRHPMYIVVIVLLFATPAALGSKYTLLLAILLSLLLIVRTYFEDRTLHAELEGYSEYARRTPYRLIPGIW